MKEVTLNFFFMKKLLTLFVIIALLFLGWYFSRRAAQEEAAALYLYEAPGFTLSLPKNDEGGSAYAVDESHRYQASPSKVLRGVKFTIPASLAALTNLSSDTYLSVETLPEVSECSAALFLDGTHEVATVIEEGTEYSVASMSTAGAGNRYEEYVYALRGSDPCVAVRYVVHSTALENYDPGTRTAFDRDALLDQFDEIRHTLKVTNE